MNTDSLMDDGGLYCSEAPACSEGPMASDDQAVLEDDRVLDNLLQLQRFSMVPQDYFTHIQQIEPHSRFIVTKWMLSVCEELGCELQVFMVATNLLDRFLCACVVSKQQLQLLATVCLLLASKMRQCRSLPVELLSYYTEYSVTQQEIRSWELLVISKLGWDLSPVTAFDFVDQLLRRVRGLDRDPEVVRQHATTFVCIAATEPAFVQLEPSALAVAGIGSAIRGLVPAAEWTRALRTMCAAVQLDPEALVPLVREVDLVVERMAIEPSQASSTQQPVTPTQKQQPELMEFFDGNKTPTEVADIDF